MGLIEVAAFLGEHTPTNDCLVLRECDGALKSLYAVEPLRRHANLSLEKLDKAPLAQPGFARYLPNRQFAARERIRGICNLRSAFQVSKHVVCKRLLEDLKSLGGQARHT